MNRGLWTKAIREARLATLLFGVGVFIFEIALAAVLPSLSEQLENSLLQIPFFRPVLQALIGMDIGEQFGPLVVVSIALVHPAVLALIAAQEIVFCTRMPVGEIDRGTIDVVLGLPVSRWKAYVTESVVWLLTGAFVLLMALLGNSIGALLAPAGYTAEFGRVLVVLLNLFCLYLAVGGLTYFVSACSERRGRAVGAMFAFVLASFFLQILGQFWAPAQSFSFVSVLTYYRPFDVLQTGAWPVTDMLVLVGFAGAFWWGGGRVFSRRDICTT